LQLQSQRALFSRMSLLVLARGLMNRGSEAGIAATAATAARHHHALVGMGEVMHHLAGHFVVNDSSDGDLQHHAFALAAGFVGTLAMASALGLVFGIEAEVHQGVVALARFHHHVATMTAIAAGGTAARHELLAPEGHAAVAAIARLHPDSCFVNEHGKSTGSNHHTKSWARGSELVSQIGSGLL